MALSHLVGHDPSQGLAAARRAADVMPDLNSAYRTAAAALVDLGRMQEARALAAKHATLMPSYRISTHRMLQHHRDRDFVARFIGALVRAGVPE
jgi:hypothetical protein